MMVKLPMSRLTSIIIDADDTLWESGLFYRKTMDSFVELMKQYGVSPSTVVNECKARDRESFRLGQYGVCYFNERLRQVCEKFVKKTHDDTCQRRLDNILNDHYEHPLRLLKDVRNTLVNLKKSGYRLFLYTKGDEEHQLLKINKSRLLPLFDDYAIVKTKNTMMLKQHLDRWNLKSNEVAVVGDNYTDDILPALGLVCITFYVPHITALGRKICCSQSPDIVVLDNISDIIKYLQQC